jgi:hypothetical protein
LARSRTSGRAGARRPAAPEPTPPDDVSASGHRPEAAPSLAAATLPRVWLGVGYRPLADAAQARALFDFAAVSWPERPALAWGAWLAAEGGERLVGALAAERHASAALLHGPVIATALLGAPGDALEIASQLLGAAIDHATALGTATLYARPQGLDRVWVRLGFIPVPEVALPPALAGRPGAGLYAWRGGSALWTLREAAGG